MRSLSLFSFLLFVAIILLLPQEGESGIVRRLRKIVATGLETIHLATECAKGVINHNDETDLKCCACELVLKTVFEAIELAIQAGEIYIDYGRVGSVFKKTRIFAKVARSALITGFKKQKQKLATRSELTLDSLEASLDQAIDSTEAEITDKICKELLNACGNPPPVLPSLGRPSFSSFPRVSPSSGGNQGGPGNPPGPNVVDVGQNVTVAVQFGTNDCSSSPFEIIYSIFGGVNLSGMNFSTCNSSFWAAHPCLGGSQSQMAESQSEFCSTSTAVPTPGWLMLMQYKTLIGCGGVPGQVSAWPIGVCHIRNAALQGGFLPTIWQKAVCSSNSYAVQGYSDDQCRFPIGNSSTIVPENTCFNLNLNHYKFFCG